MCVPMSHSFNIFQCAFSNVPSEHLHNDLQNHIPCIYSIFLCVLFHVPCAFSCVSSDLLQGWMHNHIDCIYVTFHLCVSSNVPSYCWHEQRHTHIYCICMVCLHCVPLNAFSKYLLVQMLCHNVCIYIL